MEFVSFALLGLATGAIYGLLSQGLVLIYRGSGLLNFAQGAMAMFGAYAYYEFTERDGWSPVGAFAVTLVLCALLGALIQFAVLRPMRKASALSRVIATLGVVLILQSAAFLRYGPDTQTVPSLFPQRIVQLGIGGLAIGEDRICILAIVVGLSGLLYVVYRYTALGRLTAAVAEHEVAAASLGHSPNLIATVNWTVGSLLAGLAGVLIAPIVLIDPKSMILLVVPAMAAALVGQFRSFGIALAAALVLGVAQSELQLYVSSPGWPTAAPFLAVVALLIIRGRSLPLRSFVLEKLPAVGNGRIRWPWAVLFAAVVCAISLASSANWATAIASTAGMGIVSLSIVVLTGYAGQLSLAQYVLAGVGALVAARLSPHLPFLLALLIGAAATAVFGGIVGMPALRTRGITLAVVTLGLASAVSAVVLSNAALNGSSSAAAGLVVPTPNVFGWDIDPVLHSNRYAFLVVLVLVLISLGVANLRRGVTGRRMLAVRSNERAAASLGINVAWVKTYAFVVASAIAAAGGILLAFMLPTVQVASFDVFTCLLLVAVTVMAGVGNIPGAYIGALITAGGIVSQLFSQLSKIDDYLPLAGGIALVLNLIVSPDGLFEILRKQVAYVTAPLGARLSRHRPTASAARARLSLDPVPVSVAPRALQVSHLSVSFGGVFAVQDVSLEVRPGEVHGLIGPNGAGKTTLIDAITGFVRAGRGAVALGDVAISNWSPQRRARHGLARSFQSLELFTDLSVAENVAMADGAARWYCGLTDFIRPKGITLGAAGTRALREMELDGLVHKRPTEISFGQRKVVAIARSIATAPSVLLLDEPAAGLDDHEAAGLAMLIRQLADDWGIAVLLVEHKVDMIMAISDRVTVLQGGQILASGTPDEIRGDPAVIDAYLGTVGRGGAGPARSASSADRSLG